LVDQGSGYQDGGHDAQRLTGLERPIEAPNAKACGF